MQALSRESIWRRLAFGLAGLRHRAVHFLRRMDAKQFRPVSASGCVGQTRTSGPASRGMQTDGRRSLLRCCVPGQALASGFAGQMLLSFRLGWLAAVTADDWHNQPTQPTPPQRPGFDEAALIAQAQRGHLPAFNQLILHYQSLVYNVAYRVMGDEGLAEDATQEAFLKAYQRVNQYRGGSFKAWLLRIVTNTCYDALRARRRRPTVPLDRDDDEEDADYNPWLVDRAEHPDSFVMRQELAEVIQGAIGRLPPDQRTALILADIEGLDYQEIADAMGTALGTVKSRLSRARAKMRDMLMAHQELLPAQYRLSDDR